MRVSSICALFLVLASPSAFAGDWDLNIARLCSIQTERGLVECGGTYDRSTYGQVEGVLQDNAAFRALMSELGVVFAPNILSPAETYGYNGFSFAVEFGFTTINPKKNSINRLPGRDPDDPQRYWRAAKSVSDTVFEGSTENPTPSLGNDRLERELPPSIAPTVTIMARKGLWLPLPSFEIGVGVRHLINSRMWSGIAEAKFALHEGFQFWPLPALAARGTVSRVFNTPGFSLTVAGLDFSISKHFGVASTFNLMPYLGYQLLWVIASSEVLDATPGVDAIALSSTRTQCTHDDCNANFTFDDQSNILRHRFFIGMRVNFYVSSLLVEYSYIAAGAADDKLFEGAIAVPDDSGAQHTVNFAVALDW